MWGGVIGSNPVNWQGQPSQSSSQPVKLLVLKKYLGSLAWFFENFLIKDWNIQVWLLAIALANKARHIQFPKPRLCPWYNFAYHSCVLDSSNWLHKLPVQRTWAWQKNIYAGYKMLTLWNCAIVWCLTPQSRSILSVALLSLPGRLFIKDKLTRKFFAPGSIDCCLIFKSLGKSSNTKEEQIFFSSSIYGYF